MAAKKLRAVGPDEKPAPPQPKTIKAAADTSERALLVALRTYLAEQLDKGAVPAHALGTVTSNVRKYDQEIRALDAREEQEAARRGFSESQDESFDASAI